MAEDKETLLSEFLGLKGLIRAHLDWEAENDGPGLPEVVLSPRIEPASLPVTAEERALSLSPSMQPPPPAEAPRAPTASASERRTHLAVLAAEAATCTKCGLHAGRSKSVFARGNPDSPVVFVGEGPGYNEDQQGLPFVGQAGQLLDKMIAAMGFNVDDVYICNVVKCRPPENRTPLPPEMDACMPYLREQLNVISPQVIVALGRVAGQGLGCFTAEARGWRGVWSTWEGVPVMPTYHPAFLLRSPEHKRVVWEDLQKVMTRLAKR